MVKKIRAQIVFFRFATLGLINGRMIKFFFFENFFSVKKLFTLQKIIKPSNIVLNVSHFEGVQTQVQLLYNNVGQLNHFGVNYDCTNIKNSF